MAIIFAPVKAIRIVRGTKWEDDLSLVDKDTGNPINLVGITSLLMRIRRSIASPILLELSIANGHLTIVDGAAGRIGIRVPSAMTLTLPENGHRKARYGYDMVIERTDGRRRKSQSRPSIPLRPHRRPATTRSTRSIRSDTGS